MQKTMQVIRKRELLPMLGVTDPTIWRWERAGKFPKRIRLGASACGWFKHEVEDWLRSRQEQ